MIVLAEMCKIIEPCAELMARGMWNDAITPRMLAPVCDVKPSTVLFCSRSAKVMWKDEPELTFAHLLNTKDQLERANFPSA